MNIMFGFVITALMIFSTSVRAEKKSLARHPASLKASPESKKQSDKKLMQHYAEHLFNQADESPAKIKEVSQ